MKKIFEFLGWVLVISVLSDIFTLLLLPYSIVFNETGKITLGYIIYAIIGIFICTPTPFIASYIIQKKYDNISFKNFIKNIFKTNNLLMAVLVPVCFYLFILLFALKFGVRTDIKWYMIILSFPILIIGGGIEEVGWRGYLEKELEDKCPYLISIIITSVIWFSWHLPLWLDQTSNHYNDSIIGFFITIVTLSFILTTIYKLTKCTFSCVCFHAAINSIGSIYDWNLLFDIFTKDGSQIVCFIIIIIVSIILWILKDKYDNKFKKEVN